MSQFKASFISLSSYVNESMERNWSLWKRYELERDIRDLKRKFGLLSFVLMLIGMFSNCLVSMVIIRSRRMHYRTLANIFILNLSIADIMFRVVYLVTRMIVPMMHWKVSVLQCKVMLYCHYACAAVTFACLAGIAIDRYQHIMFPLKFLDMKRCRRFLIVLVFWVYAVVVSMGFFIVGEDRPYRIAFRVSHSNHTESPEIILKTTVRRCTLKRGALSSQLAFTPYFIFAFCIPLSILSVTYATVFRRLSERNKHNIGKITAIAKRKALKMLVLVVVSFLISWAPIMVMDLLRVYDTGSNILPPSQYPYRSVTETLSHTSSIINPFIYAFGNANFRKDMKKLFRACVCVKWDRAFAQNQVAKLRGNQVAMQPA